MRLHEPGEHVARARPRRSASTPARAAIQRTDSTQRTGPSIWRTSASRAAAPVATGARVDVGHHRHARVAERARPRASASRPSRAGAISGEWNGAETGSGSARLAPALLGQRHGALDRRLVAGDHRLLRRVEVGHRADLAVAVAASARHRGDRRRRRARGSPPSRPRRPAPPPASARRAGAPGAARRRSRSAPAATSAEYSPRLWPATAAGASGRAPRAARADRDRGGEHRRLGVGGELQLLLRPLPAEPRERERRAPSSASSKARRASGKAVGPGACPCRPSASPGRGRRRRPCSGLARQRLDLRPARQRAAPPRPCSSATLSRILWCRSAAQNSTARRMALLDGARVRAAVADEAAAVDAEQRRGAVLGVVGAPPEGDRRPAWPAQAAEPRARGCAAAPRAACSTISSASDSAALSTHVADEAVADHDVDRRR